ncbi:MAG: sigma-70 family RNA polymerase sigma factor [Acidobacteria bacterium]|nr:sigma-70 family RNA polymerase sigma factor [Acidobacteriota bacterium]MBS1866374.1 sigma-70 family RNA polymerase sigma factor [Acidobacteriota bacterium]
MARVTNTDPSRAGLPAGSVAAKGPLSAEPKDRELVRKAQRGDKGSFEELVFRHQNRVFAVARGILKRQEDVEDISQQVFVKAYFALKKFDQRSAFTTWLYKITVNECWDLLRKRKVRPLVYEADLSEEQGRAYQANENRESGQPDLTDRLDARRRVERLLGFLDERDRGMLVLKEVEGFAIEEIAEIFDLNTNTVKVRLFRARQRILSQLKKAKEA